ncbi:MAG: 3-dehydroquinate synthase [Deltaproteobacteria bacterium]|nr:3-dehydroquinate synthase [Deltaproteobacteria bacterium]
MITVSLGERTYDIFFSRDIYSLFQEWICRFYPGGTVHVVTDRNVASIYGDDIRRWLAGIPHEVLALPPGEEHKNHETVGRIYEFLARGQAGRESLVVAFGGGVVGDLAGFAAATFLRGITCIQIPTTLLAQVDSSVGGKTGFNLPEGKNLVGAFHQPRAVFIDDAFLRTLDDRNLLAGLAEVVKIGLAGDPELWERLRAEGARWKGFSGDDWRWLIRRAIAFKASVVEKDERESSLRRILNLGHTVGHAMERASGFGRLLHGEAVAMGLAWEAVLGHRLGVTEERLVGEVVSLLLAMGYELDDPGMPLSSIAAAMGSDKKRLVADVDLPLIAAPGRCELRRVPLSEIRRELPSIRAEVRERSAGRGSAASSAEPELPFPSPEPSPGGGDDAVRSLERRVTSNPRDNDAITLLADAYRESGNVTAAWQAIQVVLERNPSFVPAQRVASDIGRTVPGESKPEESPAAHPLANLVLVGDESYEIRSAEEVLPLETGRTRLRDAEPTEAREPGPDVGVPASPAVGTITLADVYWSQGERRTARGIVGEILARDPENARALAWMADRGEEDPVEAVLAAFLDMTAKEYGYDLSRYH